MDGRFWAPAEGEWGDAGDRGRNNSAGSADQRNAWTHPARKAACFSRIGTG
jgi:hypothetical protein